MIETVTVAKWNVEDLEKAIDKLNKKARKFGTAPLVLTYNNEHTVSYAHHPATGHKLVSPLVVEYVDATLEYEIPVIEGWEFYAKFDIYPSENGENVVIVSKKPDVEIPVEFQNKTEIHCDHCGYNRNRYHSILLRNIESGEWKEVGSTCVRDFIGYDPSAFLFYASIDFKDVCGRLDSGSGYGRKLYSFGLREVLTYSNAVIKKFGWKSKSAAYEFGGESTADRVWDNLDPSAEILKNHRELLVSVTDEDEKLASEAVEYFKTVDAGDNDYLITCKKIAELGYVPFKHMGYACSMINGYNRYLEKESYKKNLTTSIPASGHVGNIKDRITVKVKCLFAKDIETQFGLSTLFIFVDEKGNIFKTFYSGSNLGAEKDGIYNLSGTVKRHSEYKGKKETMLNRCKVVENNTEFAFVDNGLIKEDEFSVA